MHVCVVCVCVCVRVHEHSCELAKHITELAVEVKTVVIRAQNDPAFLCQFFGLCGPPHTKNENSTFNQDIIDWLGDHRPLC